MPCRIPRVRNSCRCTFRAKKKRVREHVSAPNTSACVKPVCSFIYPTEARASRVSVWVFIRMLARGICANVRYLLDYDLHTLHAAPKMMSSAVCVIFAGTLFKAQTTMRHGANSNDDDDVTDATKLCCRCTIGRDVYLCVCIMRRCACWGKPPRETEL